MNLSILVVAASVDALGSGNDNYRLAKNAGTSVNQIERFYAKRLPISKEVMENLQSFGG